MTVSSALGVQRQESLEPCFCNIAIFTARDHGYSLAQKIWATEQSNLKCLVLTWARKIKVSIRGVRSSCPYLFFFFHIGVNSCVSYTFEISASAHLRRHNKRVNCKLYDLMYVT